MFCGLYLRFRVVYLAIDGMIFLPSEVFSFRIFMLEWDQVKPVFLN